MEGYQPEYADGLRDTVDLLVADDNLRRPQVALAAARHDAVMAKAALLSAFGRLEVRRLLPDRPSYNPVVPYRRSRDKGGLPWEGAVAALDQDG